jgi:hypothetical protein
VPYFYPLIDVVEFGVKAKARPPYTTRVFVDGIDRKKAGELTSALRLRGVLLEMVKSRRDGERTSHSPGGHVGGVHPRGDPR